MLFFFSQCHLHHVKCVNQLICIRGKSPDFFYFLFRRCGLLYLRWQVCASLIEFFKIRYRFLREEENHLECAIVKLFRIFNVFCDVSCSAHGWQDVHVKFLSLLSVQYWFLLLELFIVRVIHIIELLIPLLIRSKSSTYNSRGRLSRMNSIAFWHKVLATLALSLEILLPINANFSLRNAFSYLSVVLRNILFCFILPIFPYQLAFLLVNSFVFQCQRVRVFVLRNVRDRLR